MISPAATPNSLVYVVGSESAPDTSLPKPMEYSHADVMHALNPLQHVPVVGMIYRAATGEQIPPPLRIAGAGLLGGPLGIIGAGFMGLLEAILSMKPDLSRPAVPAGMSQTGSESGVEPVSPGTLTGTAYTTLATVTPDFLQSPWDQTSGTALAQNGAAAYRTAATEWQRAQAVEKGLG